MTIQTDDFNLADLPPSRRVISSAPDSPKEEAIERALRPKLFDQYVGQTKIREQLEIFIGAAKKRSTGWMGQFFLLCCFAILDGDTINKCHCQYNQ